MRTGSSARIIGLDVAPESRGSRTTKRRQSGEVGFPASLAAMLQANQLSDWPICRSYQCFVNNLAGAKDRAQQAETNHLRLRSVKPLWQSLGFQTVGLPNCSVGHAIPIGAV